MKRTFIPFFVLFAFIAEAQTTNYQVHSLFVLNIAKYSTWPAASPDFHIVVFGKSKMYDELTKQMTGKQINGLTVRVTQTDDVSAAIGAQLLFLADSKSSSLSEILKATEGNSTLVIAEREGLYKKGAAFSFVLMDNNTLRYDINQVELAKRSIRVSKNLTSLANSAI